MVFFPYTAAYLQSVNVSLKALKLIIRPNLLKKKEFSFLSPYFPSPIIGLPRCEGELSLMASTS